MFYQKLTLSGIFFTYRYQGCYETWVIAADFPRGLFEEQAVMSFRQSMADLGF
ncbi:Unknown protein sequence [Pseudomonas syringae pv. syringae]|nr:Unknown protein sequence [Pseudomonas syringae pv. syringae]